MTADETERILPRDLRFRRAGTGDLETVVGLLSEAAQWAKSRGVERWWPVPYPADWVRRSIERQEVVIVEIGSRAVGTLTLSREDARMWGKQAAIGGYVHRITVRRDLAGQGLGRALLSWAEQEVRRWGRSKLRLDCLATNESLVRYYLGEGFREVGRIRGNIPGEDRPSVLMERDVPASPRLS